MYRQGMSRIIKTSNDDVVYRDENVCILKPDASRGVVILHAYPKNMNHLIEQSGGRQTNHEYKVHPYLVFKCPINLMEMPSKCTSRMLQLTYDSLYDVSHYDYFCIRVDPEHTFVYNSLLKSHDYIFDYDYRQSKQNMIEFLSKIDMNRKFISDERRRGNFKTPFYNKYTKDVLMNYDGTPSPSWYTTYPPDRLGEILVYRNVPLEWRVSVF